MTFGVRIVHMPSNHRADVDAKLTVDETDYGYFVSFLLDGQEIFRMGREAAAQLAKSLEIMTRPPAC